ncbi:unnamed protein product, partial [Mesorhabditis spiculigera]
MHPAILIFAFVLGFVVADNECKKDGQEIKRNNFVYVCVESKVVPGLHLMKFKGCMLKDVNLKDALIPSGEKGYANGSKVTKFGFRMTCGEDDKGVYTKADGCYVRKEDNVPVTDVEIDSKEELEDVTGTMTVECKKVGEEVRINFQYPVGGK